MKVSQLRTPATGHACPVERKTSLNASHASRPLLSSSSTRPNSRAWTTAQQHSTKRIEDAISAMPAAMIARTTPSNAPRASLELTCSGMHVLKNVHITA